ENDELLISISDNGRGLSSQEENGGGMGLLNLQYRARAIGGKITIESQPGKGATIRCAVSYGRIAGLQG
ncbi:MAG: hypothetical protein JWL90_4346, partial [Chthoniobacteraceae bacterium]|nr:hypothetical protein [Chthoniobacteraceae bacterium]